MRIYLVGGAVRDKVRGLAPVDLDYVAVGGSEGELRRLVPGLTRVGRGIPVFVRGKAQYTLSGFASIEDDLASRDLTVNALAEDEEGRLYAHPGPWPTCATASCARGPANFLADPLRAVRAARFAAAFPDFTVHGDLLAAMRAVPPGALGAVAAERVGQETLKACAAPVPGNFLRVLRDGGCLEPWLAEFRDADAIPAGPPAFHDASVLEHTAGVMDRCAGEPVRVWMALCHDLGKTLTPRDLLPHHFGHEDAGRELAEALSLRLRLPGRFGTAGRLAARWHMAAGRYGGLRASTRVRMLLELDKAGVVEPFFRLVAADGGEDFQARAGEELRQIKAVRLPEKHRDQGPRSAEVLLQLRCEALARLAGVEDDGTGVRPGEEA
jgi:tRNA nucleotidyltransferase (CCA-adding enzyme)